MGIVFKMLKGAVEVAGAMAATAASPPPAGSGGPCALAGEWVPCRHDEWRNRNPGRAHKARARDSHSRVTYDATGRGFGRVGELSVHYSVSTVAPRHYTATAKVPLLLWSATDGNLTLHHDGTLEVQYPSNGIKEFWRRADGRGTEALPRAHAPSRPSRPLKLLLRHFGPGSLLGSSADLKWHWGLAVGDENACYEVAGSMAVIGPNGIIAASSPFATNIKPTKLSQFDAFLSLPQTTLKNEHEIEDFTRQWVRQHPMYAVLGPNCQTFCDDLFAFLCGQHLPFSKSASRLDTFGRGDGPEHNPSTAWLKPEMQPS